jgi:hypothetical protein
LNCGIDVAAKDYGRRTRILLSAQTWIELGEVRKTPRNQAKKPFDLLAERLLETSNRGDRI